MTDVQFVQLCKETVANYVNDHLEKTDNAFISPDNVYIEYFRCSLRTVEYHREF